MSDARTFEKVGIGTVNNLILILLYYDNKWNGGTGKRNALTFYSYSNDRGIFFLYIELSIAGVINLVKFNTCHLFPNFSGSRGTILVMKNV